MPPTVVGTGTVASGTTTCTPPLVGSLAVNDVMIDVAESVGGQNITLPSGWAHVTGSPVVCSTLTQLTVIWRRFQTGDAAPALAGTVDHVIGRMIGIRGCPSQGNPWNVVANVIENTSDTSATFPAVTTTLDDTLALFIISTAADIATAQLAALTGGTGLTNIVEHIDNATATGNGGVIGLISATKATQGSTGAPSVTLTTAAQKSFMTLAMAPLGQRIQRPRRSFIPIDHAFRH